MSDVANEVEALLFLYAKELTPHQIAKLLGRKEEEVEEALKELEERYKEGALFLRKVGRSYSLTVKNEYAERLRDVIKRKELSSRALKVLAVVKKYEGITKARIARSLGSWVYDAIKELREKGFIKEVKVGRSSSLRLTERFKDYFGET